MTMAQYDYWFRKVCKWVIYILCIPLILGATLFLLYILYFYFTTPSWGELDALIDRESVVVLDSKHSKLDGYEAEFLIFIPQEKDRLRFLSNIKRIGEASLLVTEHRATGEEEFSFRYQIYWVRVIGKDGNYLINKHAVFSSQH